jgi:leucyl aminopeptidase (aminopeptidase T)
VNSEVLDWRRQKIIGINFEDIAQKIVNTCLAIKENEKVVISYQPMHQKLVEDLMIEISKKGAYPIPIIWTKRIEYNFIKNVPLKYTGKDVISDFLLDKIDAHIIFTGEFLKESDEFQITPDLQKKSEFIEQIKRDNIRKTYKTDVRYLTIDTLRIDRLLELNLNYESSCEMYWKALDTDTDGLSNNCKEVEKRLHSAKYFEMKDNDYKLTINLPEQKIISVQDGLADSPGKDTELPAGMVVCLLKDADVNGKCKADFAYLFERKFENVELIIKYGRIVEIYSENDNEILHNMFKIAKGDKDLVGSFCIGLNPELHHDIGNPYIDTKIYGGLSLQAGWDELEMSNVDSDMVAQFYFLNKTLTLDNFILKL